MTKYNFDLQREHKRPVNRGKLIRLALLFCLVAAITAAVIYAIVPRSAPENGTSTEGSKKAEEKIESSGTENTADKSDPSAADDGKIEQTPANEPEKSSGSAAVAQPAGDDGAEKNTENISAGAESTGSKYAPSTEELTGNTAGIRKSLADGSWKKQRDVIVHKVVSGDSLEKLARKYHTTQQFLQKFNGITNANAIRIDQLIYCFRADRWEIVISRSKGSLQVNRMIGGNPVPFIVLPCRAESGVKRSDLVVSTRFSEPVYIDSLGRKFLSGSPENPYGEGQLILAPQGGEGSWLSYSIHGEGESKAVAGSLKSGSIVLNNEDIKLLYLLIPEKTAVKITE